MPIDWTQVLIAVIAGALSGTFVLAIANALRLRSESKRSDAKSYIEAADTISDVSADMLKRMGERLAALEEKCQRYEMAFESMRMDLIQARSTITQLEFENSDLRRRVKHLEDENTELRQRLEQMESGPGGIDAA